MAVARRSSHSWQVVRRTAKENLRRTSAIYGGDAVTYPDAVPTSFSGRPLTWVARCPACGADAVWTASAAGTAVDCDCDPTSEDAA